MKSAKVALVLAVICMFTAFLQAQTAPNYENGWKPFGSYDGSHLDTVNLMNGNLMLHAPIVPDLPQRGAFSMSEILYTSSKDWQVVCVPKPTGPLMCSWKNGGSQLQVQTSVGMTVRRTLETLYEEGTPEAYSTFNYSLTTMDGATHQLTPVAGSRDPNYSFDTFDLTGYHVDITIPDANGIGTTAIITDRRGMQYQGMFSGSAPGTSPVCRIPQTSNNLPHSSSGIAPMVDDSSGGAADCSQVAYASLVTDSNGNQMILTPRAESSTARDTLGRVPQLFLSGPAYSSADPTGCGGAHPFYYSSVFYYIDPNGSTQPVKLCYSQLTVHTAFNQMAYGTIPVGEFDSSLLPSPYAGLTNVILADGTKWAFDYDNYGEVTYIGLPTGGSITYTWTTINFSSCDFTNPALVSRAVATRTLDDGQGHTEHWQYHWGTATSAGLTNTVTDPLQNDTVHIFTAQIPPNFGQGGACSLYETSAIAYQGSQGGNHPLQRVDTAYSSQYYIPSAGQGVIAGIGSVFATDVTTTVYPSGKVKKIHKDPDAGPGNGAPIFGNVKKELEYDWGPGASGALLRETDTTYQWETNSAYLTAHLLDLPASVVVKDGSGNRVAETDYTYDEANYLTTPTPAVTTQHTTPPYGVRGNRSTASHWLNTSNSFVASHTKWFDTGEVYQKIDPLGHTTTYSYDPAYVGGYVTETCSPPTNSIAHCVSGTYDFNTGVLTSLTNENATTQASGNTQGDAAHTSNYTYDFMFRITSAQAPPDSANSGARAENTFTFSPPNVFPLSMQRTKSITNALSDSATSFFDGLGRSNRTQHAVPGNTATVDTTFDAAGHPATVSNPYFSTSDPTYGTTTSLYDALDRVTEIVKQDGSISLVSYDQAITGAQGNCTTTTDEASKQRRTCSDALGRLVEVDEPGGSSPGVQATASITINGAFNSTSVSASPIHLAAVGTALSSLTMGDGSSHTFYFDTNQHLCHLSWNSTAGWANQDLTDQTEAGSAMTGSSISAVLFGSTLHVFYQGANQHIYNMEWTGTAWQNLDLTVLTGATAISGTKLSAVVSGPNSPELFYESTNQHFYMVYWVASSSVWSNADMSSITGQTTLMATNSSVSSGIYGSGFYGFYLGTNQHLITVYWSGSAWATADVTALSGGALATAGSSLTTLSIGAGSTPMMTFYEGPSQHIYSIYWTTTSVWQTLDFTSFSGATNVAAAATALTNNNPSIQAFYFSTTQHIDDINWNGSAWVNSDLTSLSGATVAAAAGSSLSAHGTSAGNTYHVFSTGADQHIYDTYYSPSPSGWHNQDLFAVATNYLIDAGTVSLTIPNATSSFTATVCYGASINAACAGKQVNASASDIANALAGVLNGTGSPVTAIASGATLNLTWRSPGDVTPVIGSITSISDFPTQFPNGSFTSAEASFSNGLAVGSQTLTSPQVTLYQYDPLGNLLRVDQKGNAPSDSTQWRTRIFTYDSLSRLLTATNPESGTISYSYDADGSLLQKTSPAPNQTGSATQMVSYCYDELHRVIGKGYGAQGCPLTSPVVSYVYDSGANAKGKLTGLTDQAGTANYTYDLLGRLSTETRMLIGAGTPPPGTDVPTVTKTLSYDYNLDGSLKALHYPSGSVVNYTPDSAGRVVSAVDSDHGINYITGATYGPNGALTSFVSGYSSSFAGVINAFAYNRRLQPLTMSATAPSQTVYSIGYDFHAGTGTPASGTDNGNVFGIYNYKDSNRNQSFTYDSLNRLTSAQNAGTDCTAKILQNKSEYWGNNYVYDAWGNMLQKSITKCGAENLQVTADGHNWIHTSAPDYQYDAAGNMTYDATASLSYTFDQENRLTGASGYTYTYDGDGNRVKKSNITTGTLYWYMTPGIVGESDLSGNLTDEYIFLGGERVARKSTNGIFYYFSDHLKTASAVTDSLGNIKSESDFYPWGGELQFVNNDSNHYKFTGKERDSETGLDYFGARYYSNGLGRWVSADWSPIPVPVPYANLTDPQSLNLYGYVRNAPSSQADLNGHFFEQLKNKLFGAAHCWCTNDQANAKIDKMRNDLINWGARFDGKTPDYKNLSSRQVSDYWHQFNDAANAFKRQQTQQAEQFAFLRFLHGRDTQSNIDSIRKMSTEDIIESLKPGPTNPESLQVKLNGTVMNGNTRLRVLEERGIDIQNLPRDIHVTDTVGPTISEEIEEIIETGEIGGDPIP
ncbi:MAG TPA: RHS repeat-associated core domain-containing protein [Candidatus Angelobacter sp.]|jgi:RHS repeat-associated protein